jgi:hypothetical protein
MVFHTCGVAFVKFRMVFHACGVAFVKFRMVFHTCGVAFVKFRMVFHNIFSLKNMSKQHICCHFIGIIINLRLWAGYRQLSCLL